MHLETSRPIAFAFARREHVVHSQGHQCRESSGISNYDDSVVRQKGALQMAKVDAKGDADRTDTKGKLDIQRENNAESRIFGKLSS